jgi:hypothetical protein
MKVRTRFPTVFVGHAFRKFPYRRFREFFRELPFRVVYANTHIETRHLLQVLKKELRQADFAIFDLSDWNPNVSLELGMCETMHADRSLDYYILLNTRRAREVPSDIKGIQRLEYSRYDFRPERGLGDALLNILKKEYWCRRIIEELRREISERDRLDKSVLVALRICAHFREFERLTDENLRRYARGTHFRTRDISTILQAMQNLRILRRGGAGVFHRARNLF